jgi:hypothetical protein
VSFVADVAELDDDDEEDEDDDEHAAEPVRLFPFSNVNLVAVDNGDEEFEFEEDKLFELRLRDDDEVGNIFKSIWVFVL